MSRTPGPWRVTSGGQVTARFFNRHFGDVSPLSLYRSMEVRRANARLIAAAPEMLEALQNIENDDGSIPEHAWQMIQNAITKATGEEVDDE